MVSGFATRLGCRTTRSVTRGKDTTDVRGVHARREDASHVFPLGVRSWKMIDAPRVAWNENARGWIWRRRAPARTQSETLYGSNKRAAPWNGPREMIARISRSVPAPFTDGLAMRVARSTRAGIHSFRDSRHLPVRGRPGTCPFPSVSMPRDPFQWVASIAVPG